MRLEYQILSAAALDLLLGDPQWLAHPVRGIGRLATLAESSARGLIRPAWAAGLAAALSVYLAVGVAAWGAACLAALVHPWLAAGVTVYLIYSTLAARDLMKHGMAVFDALVAQDLLQARRRVSSIVGRDTDSLDESGVIRATVESVAESTVDGVTAPLMFAAIGGPVAAMVYRAVSTLDSMFGYRNDRYREFGWAAARMDDLANYLPARLTAPLISLSAALLGCRPCQSLGILWRDAAKHASPNSGLPEAAMAGALGVQLGGTDYYAGRAVAKATLGDPHVPLAVGHIPKANALMLLSSGLVLAVVLTLRIGAGFLMQAWGWTG